MLNALKSIKKSYDPVNFHLIHSLKATLAVALSATFAYTFFGFVGAVFAVNISMSIFFLANIEGTDTQRLQFILLYIVLACIFVPFVKPLIQLGVWLCVVVFFWVFIIGISAIYSENLNKILLATNITGFTGLIVYGNSGLDIKNTIAGIIIGGVIAGVIRVGKFVKYGKFTIKSISLLIKELINATNNIDNANFSKHINECFARIDEFKALFSNDSINIKDASLIKNQTRAIFYIYKIEEITLLISSISPFFSRIDDKILLKNAKNELIFNLNELLKIFTKEQISFKTDTLNELKNSNYKVFCSSLAAIFAKISLIKDGNDDKIEFKSNSKISLSEFLNSINLKNQTTLNSLRLSVCMCVAVFISQAWHINHGLWIAIAVMSLSKNNRYMLKNAGRDNIVGGFFGFFIGFLAISLFKNNLFIHVLAALGMFFVFYFKVYKQIVFTTIFMSEFCIIYSFIRSDFLDVVMLRLFDILIGFGLVFVISMLTLPKDRSEFNAKFKKILNDFTDFIQNNLTNFSQDGFLKYQNTIIKDISDYKELLDNVKLKNIDKVYINLNKINGGIINLKTYINENKIENDVNLQSDIKTLNSRFEMLNKKIDGLPFYFISEIDDKLIYKDDAKISKLIMQIALMQNELYTLI
ncbi:FUSC family protein [Campylobacter gastrosuis]|uniref:FUSC family protein n=1 Tax=Campylobacter gastrosuis TaxID=2974576 RepID=A0ABT7HQJ3_9BACT|nr:FUSC family protein [Campylobacter gastrosuis]MDL0089128.1 FUSC family protein [Campylobacter gastrosuis]